MNIVEFIQARPANYTAGRGGHAIDGMAVHYTATSASAHNNLVYFSRSGAEASAHLFVDKDGSIRQYLRATYGILRVIHHYDVTGKRCPAPYVNAGKWAVLKARITAGSAAVSGGGSGGSAPSGSVANLAQRVIAGEFGNGDARRAALGNRYDEVQAEVNRILLGGGSSAPAAPAAPDIEALAQAVIRGEYGNGDARRAALGANYDAVQARVNEILLGGGDSSGGGGADIEALAQAVIRGDYGNGEERKQRLGANYAAVQARVNEILLG